jgi:hypothetical protein
MFPIRCQTAEAIIAKQNMGTPLERRYQIAILADKDAGAGSLDERSCVEWLFCKRTGESLIGFYDQGGALLSSVDLQCARLELPYLLSILFIGSADDFDAFKSRWNTALPSATIGLQRVSAWDDKAILGAALESLAGDLTLHRRESGHASLALATYRREFDRLQRNFSRLEEYVSRRHYEGATEIFEYLPDTEAPTMGRYQKEFDGVSGAEVTGLKITGAGVTDLCGSSLIQSLPVDSLGLSSFSIYLSAKAEFGDDPLRISLRAVETDHIFGEWSLGAGEVRAGWVELALNHAIDEAALSLEIVVDWPVEQNGWTLALGAPHPYPDFCARMGADDALRSPIALRLFSSLPGVRVSATTSAIKPVDALHQFAEFIPYGAYSSVAQVVPPVQDDKPTLVFYDRDIGCITVHPRVGGLAAARMEVVVPKSAWAVSAQIHLAHERASATGFGLMVCAAADESRELARLGQLDSPTLSFSGWKVLSPMETRSITIVLAAQPGRQLALYLVTRQAPDLSPDFAWARFSKFEFHVLPKSLVAENEADRETPFMTGLVHAGAE